VALDRSDRTRRSARLRAELCGRLATWVVLAAAAVGVPPLLRPGAGAVAWVGWVLLLCVGVWWSAPRATRPGWPSRVALLLGAAAWTARVPGPVAWPLPAADLALGLGLSGPRAGWTQAAAVAVVAWATEAAYGSARLGQELPLLLGLALGGTAGQAWWERRERRREILALTEARDRAETEASHLRFLLEHGRGAGVRGP